MNYFTFLSKIKPNEIGYKVIADTEFDYRFRGACRWATFFQTYGDGSVQHSSETPFARELLPDFLGSLAIALAEATDQERGEMLEIVSKHWPRHSLEKSRIRFALALKCNEKKTQYYDAQARKVSTAESKKNDRRWESIKPYDSHVDGSITSAAMILKNGDSYDDIHTIQRWREIDDVYREDHGGYSPFRIWEHFGLEEKGANRGWTETAWNAVASFVQSHRLAVDAKQQAERWAEYGAERAADADKGGAA
jgi:hypothetical protein